MPRKPLVPATDFGRQRLLDEIMGRLKAGSSNRGISCIHRSDSDPKYVLTLRTVNAPDAELARANLQRWMDSAGAYGVYLESIRLFDQEIDNEA